MQKIHIDVYISPVILQTPNFSTSWSIIPQLIHKSFYTFDFVSMERTTAFLPRKLIDGQCGPEKDVAHTETYSQGTVNMQIYDTIKIIAT
jgi:hypothetical protein